MKVHLFADLGSILQFIFIFLFFRKKLHSQILKHFPGLQESDKSDASDPDEAATSSSWTRRHNAQLGLVVGGEHHQASLSSRAEARRHSLCAENLLALKWLLAQHVCKSFQQQI